MSEIKNGRLGLYGTEHSKCNHAITLGFKGLSQSRWLLDALYLTYLLHFLFICISVSCNAVPESSADFPIISANPSPREDSSAERTHLADEPGLHRYY